jgi:uncharacterized protein (TIGR02270 family)
MATSYHAFLVELYQEYLSEASFFYERRRNAIRKPESIWIDLAELENRLEAQLDGLMVGADLALEVCRQQVEKGDFGELYAALCVFCRHRRMDLVKEVFDRLDPDDVKKIEAVGDAIKHEAPAEWRDQLVQTLNADASPAKVKVIARVVGWRRWEATAELSAALNRTAQFCLPDILWAFGRSKVPSRTTAPFELLNDHDEVICFAAALALLRRGEPQALGFLLRKLALHTWPCLPVALAGGISTGQSLLRHASVGKVSEDLLIAVGLIGIPTAVPYLIAQFATPELAPVAAVALQTITAANLWENVFVPDVVDEDELFDHEKEHRGPAGGAVRSDGKVFGGNERRLSLDPQKWNKWWSAKSQQYDPTYCYRHGELISPQAALACLESDETPNRVRALMVEEIAIRYGCDVPLEPDMSVVKQKQALTIIREWVEANGSRFEPGASYFNGKLTT